MQLRRKLVPVGALAASAALVLVAAAPAQAAGTNLVTNGNFASPATTTSLPVTSLAGWTLIDGEAEVDGANIFTPPAGSAAGTQSIDLNTDHNTSVEQVVPTVSGTTYTLSYQLAGNPSNPQLMTGNASVGGAIAQPISFNTTGHTNASMGWVLESYTFTATGPSTAINFQSTTAGPGGPVITGVSLVETPASGGPLADWPIALVTLLGLAALLGVGVTLRRRGSAGAL